MLTKEMIFNDDTLNIFTDASIVKMPDGEYIGCYGAFPITDIFIPEFLTKTLDIRRYSTNNDSELRGILLGIYQALQFRSCFKTINLFSDSLISVNGLKEWIFNWAKSIDGDGNMRSSSGLVQNQSIIERIIFMIINYQLDINIYHQRGHMNIDKEADVQKAINAFTKVNGNAPTRELMIELCKFNDLVDNTTRDTLNDYINDGFGESLRVNPIPNLIRYDMRNFDSSCYKSLIGRKK